MKVAGGMEGREGRRSSERERVFAIPLQFLCWGTDEQDNVAKQLA